MIEINNKHDCCGCKACGDICPVGAISFPVDQEGFWYPQIDKEICIKCNLCERVCPTLHPDKWKNKKNNLRIFGGYHKDIVIRFDSTSGGVFTALAQEMYSQKGYVTGAIYDENFDVVNVISNKKRDLSRLRSSKYVQSDASGLHKGIKKLLDQGEKVLACGSPCQMAGLRTFLGKDYDNLIIVDFLCRASNSPKVFHKYIEDLEARYDGKVISIKDKNKDHGWRSLARKIVFDNGKVYYGEGHDDDYRRGYHGNVFERPSCYECIYKGLPRSSDITLGDFWGIENVDPSIDKNLGTSLVMANTEKGLKYLQQIQDRMVLKEYKLDDIMPGNHQAIMGTVVVPGNIDRKAFFEDLDKMPFHECAQKYFPIEQHPVTFKHKIKNALRLAYHNRQPMQLARLVYWNLLKRNIKSNILNGKAFNPKAYHAIDIAASAKIEVDGVFNFGNKRNCKSKLESRLLLDPNAVLRVEGDLNIANGCDIQLLTGGKMTIGSGAFNMGLQIVCMDEIRMGKDVHIGRDVWIRDNNGGHSVIIKGNKNSAPIIIGDHVWICSNVNITKGVTIGDGAIISANSVVTSNVPAHSMVAGNPAAVIAEDIIWRP